jgi:multidrug efflux system membrane fusion protein
MYAGRLLARLLVVSVIASLAILAGCGNSNSSRPGGARAATAPQAIPVGVFSAEKRDMPYYLTGLGNVTAFNTVTVKTRVDGQLVQVAFQEGQEVKKGDLLVLIDPRPYEVALSQAEATLFKDQAQLQDARVNLGRFTGLFADKIIPQQQLDTQRATVNQLDGQVRADQAQVDNAKLNLVYCRITAPVGGRVGLRLVDIGNMVHATDQNGLLVITQLQPIAVVFTLPQDQLPVVSKAMAKGQLAVLAYSRDGLTKLATGKLLTIDNQIDTTTGTGKLKAVFDNHERALWPNQFVNVKLLLEVRKDNTVIPADAVQRGPQGNFTYVIKPDKTAELRPVQVSFTEGNLVSIASGLAPGEQVVTDGQDKLQSGSKVEVRSAGPGPRPQQNTGATGP